MVTETSPLNVVMFSGGRGTGSITEAFLKHGQISLTLLVNTYDDGLSTGALRKFLPGMLGPSDVRKNISRLMPDVDRADRALRSFIEYRFPLKIPREAALAALKDLCSGHPSFPLRDLAAPYQDLNIAQAETMVGYLRRFLDYLEQVADSQPPFDFGDCSFGNLLFAGCYLGANRSFNEATRQLSQFARIRGRVLNITDGENLVLVALKQNGALLLKEGEIVSTQETTAIRELYLMSDYLSPDQIHVLSSLDLEGKANFLQQLSRVPRINPAAEAALQSADIIIYGPGTQHSSLFPSYLTERVAEAIASNHQAEKVFVGNIAKDFEIRNETAGTLVEKFLFYLNSKGRFHFAWVDLVSLFFMQASDPLSQGASEYVFFDINTFPFPRDRVVLTNWERGKGSHSGGMVTDELVSLVNSKWSKKMKPFRHMVSILVPAYNEERTVKTVLQNLSRLNFEFLDLAHEIILIDGGSTDRTVELARTVPDITVHQLQSALGRGAALRMGIEKANGNIIVFFPSDNEYQPEELLSVVQAVATTDSQAVFGSRVIKCVNMNERIRTIYKGNYLMYLTSKYGGMLISILSLVLYNRFVSDPLTGVKAFDARVLKNLRLSSDGFEIETEILAKLGKQAIFILEIPVNYRPRTRAEGKKTTFGDGLHAIFKMLFCNWLR